MVVISTSMTVTGSKATSSETQRKDKRGNEQDVGSDYSRSQLIQQCRQVLASAYLCRAGKIWLRVRGRSP